MDERECEICAKLTKEKYKYYNTWRALAIVFICLTVLFAILYFGSGDLMSSTTIEYNNEVDIENDGDNNTNTDNGNIVIEKQNAIIARNRGESFIFMTSLLLSMSKSENPIAAEINPAVR